MPDANAEPEQLFESFLARESDPAGSIHDLLARHPEHAGRLRALWASYRRVLDILGDPPANAESDLVHRGRYEVRKEIAKGGMGRVLEVWDSKLRRILAMKVLRDDRERSSRTRARARSRLINEAQILGQLEHPGIVPIHEVGEDADGGPFFTMLRVRGRVLDEVFDDARAERDGWTLTRAITALLRACEAVAHAHDRGVLHRDLKPANVMVGPLGEVYVMDWGLAKARGIDSEYVDIRIDSGLGEANSHATRLAESNALDSIQTDRRDESSDAPESPLLTLAGDVVGTPSYMAPEQAEGRVNNVDERSDVYSMGAMLYHLLSGHAPYAATGTSSTPRQVLAAVLDGSPEPLERIAPRQSPAELAAVCTRAMARDATKRYPSIRALADDLRAYLEGRVVQAHRTGPIVELRKWVRRNKGTASAIAAVVLGIIGLLVVQHRSNLRVLDRAEALRKRVYFNDIALAQIAHSRNQTATMQSLLAGCPSDLRGWEWHYLHRAADTSSRTVPTGGLVAALPTKALAAMRPAQASPFEVWRGDGIQRRQIAQPDYVRSLRFDPSRSLCYVGTNEGRLLVCDWRGPTVLHRVDCGRRGRTGVVAIPSPNGEQLAIARDSGILELWQSDPPKPLARLDSGLRAFQDASWSADGSLLAAAAWELDSEGGTASAVRVYDMTDRTLRHTLSGHRAWIYSVGLSPNGQWVASSGRDYRILLWNIENEATAPRQLGSTTPDLPYVAWTPDGRRLLTTSAARIQVWDPETWEVEQVLTGLQSSITSVTALSDGTIVASDRFNTKYWQLNRRDRITQARARPGPYCIAISPDERNMAISSVDGTIEIWDVRSRLRIRALDRTIPRAWIAYSRNGKQLISLDPSGWLRILEAATGKELIAVQAHSRNNFHCLAVAPDGRHCATCAEDGRVRLWCLDSLEPVWTVTAGLANEWPAGAHSVVFSQDGNHVAVGAADGCLRILATDTGEVRRELKLSAERFRYTAAGFSPDGRVVVASVLSKPKRLVAWDLETSEILWSEVCEFEVLWPRFAADGSRVFTATQDGAIAVRDAATGTHIVTLELGTRARVQTHAATTDRSMIVLATKEGHLRFWSTESWPNSPP